MTGFKTTAFASYCSSFAGLLKGTLTGTLTGIYTSFLTLKRFLLKKKRLDGS
ncbi:hypothetical protein [Peribacillus asahii]|uniref:hypothetical protein n=1 Tax=Peribacillus asahii TaxID=228899 RepID=UPI0020799ABF|nr:hypothetical protein [Peribacillus asahii]USK62432.1 hypothetical protein LIT37_23400 [Peribacillus asahii]